MMAKGQKGRDRVERKTIERNRRMHMKGLCFKLASLVPRNHDAAAAATLPKEEPTQLDEATAYIKKLQASIDDLTHRKQAALGGDATSDAHHLHKKPLPLVDVRVVDTVLEVVLVSPAQSHNSFTLFYQVMEALEEHGAKIANAGFSVVNDNMFCTIHAQVAVPAASMEQLSVAVTHSLTNLL